MAFQTEDLALLTLGIRGDQAPDNDRPLLPDGVHLRWSISQEKGFPLHGFYLFRRESRPSQPLCLSPYLEGLLPGSTRNLRLDTQIGRLSNSQPLVWTDDFAPNGTVEADDRAGLRFDLPPGIEARRVEMRIGFRSTEPEVERRCVDFRAYPIGLGHTPREENGIVFNVVMDLASANPVGSAIAEWEKGYPGLDCGYYLTIDLPSPALRVDLLITNRYSLHIEALNDQGTTLAVRSVAPGELHRQTVRLEAEGIKRITFKGGAADPALLHECCFESRKVVETVTLGSAVEIRALSGSAVVARKAVGGRIGQVISAAIDYEGITAVEIAPGPAALVDLCYIPSKMSATFGWEEVPGFQYPLCLPVAHADYPCPGKPASLAKAESIAFSRVTYRAPAGWNQGFTELHGELEILVQGGAAGGPMSARVHPDLPGQPLSPATQSDVPKLPGLHPLDLVLIASLQPAVAQMLGLYFVDRTVPAGVGYDYLLLADPTGVLGGTAESALSWLAFEADPSKVDATLVLDRRVTTRPPIAPPGKPRAYALPGAASRAIDGTLPETAGSVGLWWPLPTDSTGEEQPDRIIFYYPKRVALGATRPSAPPPVAQYQPVPGLGPVLVSEPDPPSVPAAPNPCSPDWPPPAIAFHAVDGNLAEGWYSYRLSGQDLFGRRSSLGPPAEWYQWDPPSGTPAPWYYKLPAGHRSIDPFAIGLLDKIPPLAPLGVEAWALDPLDRWLFVDSAYEAWRAGVPDTLVGLRVRWRWTLMQHLQAPDTREFRIYYQPGRWNARLGTIVNVTAASAVESDVTLDFADSNSPGKFTGARLRVGNNDFAILGSQPGAPLRLRVKNIGAHDEVRPAEGKPCTVSIPEGHSLWVDTGHAKAWAQRLAAVPYDPPARIVVDPSKDANGVVLTDKAFAESGLSTQVSVSGATVQLPPQANLAGIQPWIDHIWLKAGTGAEKTLRILRYDIDACTVTLESTPAIGTPVHWAVGRPAREYEVFLPAPDIGIGKPFEPSLAEPAVIAQIAVSAADDKIHVSDDPKWGDPARFGNESRLSPSATIYRVLQTPPQPPALPKLPGRIYATPADYHSRSYSTFRFIKADHLRVHILRALDDSLFQRDWLIRETRKALAPTNHANFFPDTMDAAHRQAAATALNAITAESAYAGLAQDAWDVLALLPGNEGAAGKKEIYRNDGLKNRDWLIRRTRTSLSATTDASLFPNDWDATTRGAAASDLNDLKASTGYLKLKDGPLRILAGLPGNEAAFTQVTLQPFEMAAAEIHDERRPDDDAAYVAADTAVRAYTDTLPGRATNRYFYRASFVDGAQHQSALSLAGPPVYLHKVEPPRAPVITKVIAGDRQITIRWAANREPNLAEYRIYQTTNKEATRDLRLMTLVRTAGATDQEWIDTDALPLVSMHYSLVAVDSDGNSSAPSKPVLSRAFDDSRLQAPTWVSPILNPADNSVILSWISDSIDLQGVLLRRAISETEWVNLTGWMPKGVTAFTDHRTTLGEYVYRLRVVDAAGRIATADQDLKI